MVSEEQINHIAEKVENGLRKSLKGDSKPSKTIWDRVNSKIGLLIIGWLMTGVLGVMFQYTQKYFEWKRQVQFDNVKLHLEMMRDCFKECFLTQVFISEAYEWKKLLTEKKSIGQSEYQRLRERFSDLQNRRYSQHAKVQGIFIYSQDVETLSGLFGAYIDKTSGYFKDIENLGYLFQEYYSKLDRGKTEDWSKRLTTLEKSINEKIFEVNTQYEHLKIKVLEEIRRIEDENKRYRL